MKIILFNYNDKQNTVFSNVVYSSDKEIDLNFIENDDYKKFLIKRTKKPEEINFVYKENSNNLAGETLNITFNEDENIINSDLLHIIYNSLNILNNSDIMNEMFITKKEWDFWGIRIIKEKILFIF